MPHRATLPDVAQHAGVSLASASRALHGTGASAAMVERVRAAATQLGYQPHATGRSLRLRRTSQIAFAVADIGNPVYVEMMTAIQAVVGARGLRLLLAPTGSTSQDTVDLVRGLAAGSVDGLVISPLRISDELVRTLREIPVPVVVIGRPLVADALDSVSTDSAAGVGLAVEHLVATGRRCLAFLNGPLDTTPGAARRRGFDEATGAPGFRAEVVGGAVAADFTAAAGLEAARRLFASRPVPDAVVAANDLLAVGAMRAAREAGLRVPEDVAVTGMDDTDLAGLLDPTLTSVSLGTAERGRAAARLLLDRLDEPDRVRRSVLVAPRLVARESTGAVHRSAPEAAP
ncbi:LacI family DNA-binding transcriptional regulator [Cellulomonas endophytica]|uniref:LacI family DNA-binding transcriptional regulator n=1 Tax=Cellulomonas endophytica TaxID=2494735 RepID=UPI001F0CC291|nr:LacI family DNA-binding transcriptional regulator [Cellulomonas endophytica]